MFQTWKKLSVEMSGRLRILVIWDVMVLVGGETVLPSEGSSGAAWHPRRPESAVTTL
jgi:hypothetical protein